MSKEDTMNTSGPNSAYTDDQSSKSTWSMYGFAFDVDSGHLVLESATVLDTVMVAAFLIGEGFLDIDQFITGLIQTSARFCDLMTEAYLVTEAYRAREEGNSSTLTGGDKSTLTGGDHSTLTGCDFSTLTGGAESTLIGGSYSTLTGGDYSTLTGSSWSTLTGGDGSTLTGGDGSTLTGGYSSTLTGGRWSTLTGGNDSTLCWRIWDGHHYRLHRYYTGEGGVEPHMAYQYSDGKLIRVEAVVEDPRTSVMGDGRREPACHQELHAEQDAEPEGFTEEQIREAILSLVPPSSDSNLTVVLQLRGQDTLLERSWGTRYDFADAVCAALREQGEEGE